MKRPLLIIAVACVAVAGCNRRSAPESAKQLSGQTLSAELERCKQLGLKAYDDVACRAAQKESNDRFYGSKQGSAP